MWNQGNSGEEHGSNSDLQRHRLISCDFLYFGHLFEDGISPMDSFEKELKDRVGEVGKDHEREARVKSKGTAKLRQKGFKWVELHLQEKTNDEKFKIK